MGALSLRAAETVDFVKDVAPLLAQHCVKCHGPEKRQGGMRLDTKKFALEGGDLGPLFVAGDSKKSKLIELIVTDDTDERMPKKAPALKAEEIALLKKWIDGGANWPDDAVIGSGGKKKELWSLKAPVRPTLPDVKQKDWPRNPIDTLTLAKMEAHGLKPSPEADRFTLLRRLHLDLTGLPPTPEEADAFVKDTSADAYEKAVDRLLASPHFGERWGRHWLDIARYADTNGYEKDRERSIWAYRDWVINALNKDMPFDQFTIEQNAGDMLPNATDDQKIATGFHRNTMINEEGGIDVEEFRYEAIVDRVKTTSTAWLGLTVACAQCHTHKYDPITHKEYWSFFAFLNNSDEPELNLANAAIQKKREEHFKKILDLENAREALLAKSKTKPNWKPATIAQASAANGSTLAVKPGGVVLAVAAGAQPEQDTYELVLDAEGTDLSALKLDVLADTTLPSNGPGRAPNGNFVLSEISATATAPDGTPLNLKFANAEADVSQKNFDVSAAIDGNPSSGWAIDDGSGKMNKDRSATFTFADGVKLPARAKLRIKLAQLYGAKHTLGKFRVSLGYVTAAPTNETPEQTVARKQQEWETAQRPKARNWTQLKPSKATSKKYATMNLLPDNSVLASGDLPNNDVYEVEFPFEKELKNITSIRLEALTHDSLPDGGPGRAVFFSRSNFLLTEFETRLFANAEQKDPKDGTLLKLQNASQSHSEKGDRVAAKAIDGVIDTGWSVGDRYFDDAAAVFEFKEPLNAAAGSRLQVQLHQFYIHQMVIGRFRISVSSDPLPAVASGLPADAEEILLVPADKRSPEQAARLRKTFLSLTPELADQNKLIKETKRSQPRFNTSMVLTERAPENARKTHIHHRGEFLSLRAEVQPDVPEVLPQLPKDAPKNRLTFAKWLVARENPLTARVTMNRLWYQLFGRGITQTLDDFGVQGEKPNNPELLDWLSVEFMEPTKGLRKGEGAETAWSFKAMIRLMVTSNTYRQSSRVPAEAAAKDPVNEWFSRFPRVRVEAEVLRDLGMSAAGILNPKIGGPSIYPPQPASVTSTVYGGYQWNATQGAERYRRGMYTFFKRSAPFGAFMTFDAPNADECCVKRNRTNTPLGALAMLNDVMFMEFSRAMALRVMKDAQSVPERTRRAFRLALTREPDAKELAALTAFYEQQLAGFKAAGSKPKEVAVNEGQNTPANTDLNELAAWTMFCRTVLNLDEAVTRE